MYWARSCAGLVKVLGSLGCWAGAAVRSSPKVRSKLETTLREAAVGRSLPVRQAWLGRADALAVVGLWIGICVRWVC